MAFGADLGQVFSAGAGAVERDLEQALSAPLAAAHDGLIPVGGGRLAWVGNHRHGRDGRDLAYAQVYLLRFRYRLPPGATSFALPASARLKLLALSLVSQPAAASPPGTGDGGLGDGGRATGSVDGGCSCSVPRAAGFARALLLLLLACCGLALLRRL